MNEILREKAEALPSLPGVYIFKDESGRPLYVGKAKSLRHRVRSYFQESRSLDDKRDRKSTRLNSSHIQKSRMPSSA